MFFSYENGGKIIFRLLRFGSKIEKNESGGKGSAYGERRGIYRILVEKPEGKRPLGRQAKMGG